jgi:hypothetical protein
MLVLAILAVIVSLGTVFLIYFFINICRDPRKGHAIVSSRCSLDRPRPEFLSPGHSSTQTTISSTVTEEKWVKVDLGLVWRDKWSEPLCDVVTSLIKAAAGNRCGV